MESLEAAGNLQADWTLRRCWAAVRKVINDEQHPSRERAAWQQKQQQWRSVQIPDKSSRSMLMAELKMLLTGLEQEKMPERISKWKVMMKESSEDTKSRSELPVQ